MRCILKKVLLCVTPKCFYSVATKGFYPVCSLAGGYNQIPLFNLMTVIQCLFFSRTSLLCAHFRGFQVATAAASSTPACATSPHKLNQSRSPENHLLFLTAHKRLTGKMMEGRSFPIGYPIIASPIFKALVALRSETRQSKICNGFAIEIL